VAFAALDCIPGFKGITTAAGLAAGLRNAGRGLRNLGRGGLRGADDIPAPRDTPPGGRCLNGDPVDMASGEVLMLETDADLPGVLPLVLRRTHVSGYEWGRFFGTSWTSTLDERLEIDEEGVRYATEDGMILRYPAPRPGTVQAPLEGPYLPLDWDGDANGGIRITDPGTGRVRHFTPLHQAPHGTENFTLYLTRITDRNGNDITIDRGQAGIPLAVRHGGGYHMDVDCVADRVVGLRLRDPEAGEDGTRLRRFAYDVRGDLEEVHGSAPRPMVYGYDDRGRVLSWTDPEGHWYRFAYDEAGRCVAGRGEDGVLDCDIAYDEPSHTTWFTNSLGHTRRYRHDGRFRLIEASDPLGNTLRNEWNEEGRLAAQINELGHVTRFTYDAMGNLTSLARPDGGSLTAEHNELGLPVTVTEGEAGTWHHRYDSAGNLVSTVDPTNAETRYTYGDHGEVTTVTDPLGHTSRVESDAAGLPLRVIDPLGNATLHERDAFGRIRATVNPSGQRARYGWTLEGRAAWAERPDGTRETWEWNSRGKLLAHTSPDGATLTMEPWLFGQAVSRTEPDGTTYAFSYDTELNLTAVTNPQGRQWTYRYDEANRLVGETDFTGRTIAYAMDAVGRLVERSSEDGRHTIVYTRDAIGRVTHKRAGSLEFAFAYDTLGNQIRSQSPDALVSREYDAMGRLLSETVNGQATTFRYDLLGRPIERRTPAGAVSTWSYDATGRPEGLTAGEHHLRFGYDASSREVLRQLDDTLALTQEWDAHNRVTEQTVTARPTEGTDALVQRRRFGYRADGLLTTVEELTTGSREFTLDAAGRVTSLSGDDWTETYAYDAAGNMYRPGENDTSGENGSADGPAADLPTEFLGNQLRRAGRTTYEYDSQGRLIRTLKRLLNGQRRISRYHWNEDGRLVEARTPHGGHWRYQYDAAGRRIAKQRLNEEGEVTRTVTFTWDGTRLAEQSTDDGRVISWDYAQGTHRPIAQRGVSGGGTTDQTPVRSFHAVITDSSGAPAELVSPEGEIDWQLRTTLWGAPRFSDTTERSAVDCPLRFPGQYADAETGWHYNLNRYYDPHAARYVSPDPIGLAGDANQYAYVPNPLWLIDPLGLYRNPSNGRYAHDPSQPPQQHNRGTEYPSGYRQSTHDEMAARWTDEGRAAGNQTPVDASGNRIPRDQLTWRDRRGRVVPTDELTYEHREPVVEHWNREGYNTDRATRNDFYNDVDNLEPMTRSQNSRGGANLNTTYRQDVGPNYVCS
ncbi:RHS repeat-associated core domain-containing protein, partial [Streptomyces zhaozhouensis]